MKAMLAHVLMNYDVKLAIADGRRPPDRSFGTSIYPDPQAELLFRKRE